MEAEFFYLAYFNYAVETSEQESPPCEIAIVKYSLSTGIDEQYHEFVEPGIEKCLKIGKLLPTRFNVTFVAYYPGKLRLGYSYEAKLHSEKTHRIPAGGFKLASSNYIKITEKMKGMLQQAVSP